MSELLWRVFAWIVSREPVVDYLIKRAEANPYFDLPGYMKRGWVFNGYSPGAGRRKHAEWLPSIRVHHILRADHGRDKHDHPWDARTIILRNGYIETRLVDGKDVRYIRQRGDTATLNFGEYHRIDELLGDATDGPVKLNDAPAVTMFITWKYRGTWGFLVNGVKIPHREYKGEMP